MKMDWTEIVIETDADDIDRAGDIAQMVVPYGIYMEDYRNLEREAWEIAHIDLIDEALLKKDRSKGLIHVYLPPEENPAEALAFLSERYHAAGIRHQIATEVCRAQDWENNWKQYFKPLPIGKKLLIRPLWEQEYNAEAAKSFTWSRGLPSAQADITPRACALKRLNSYVTPETELLDIGCGSGILSLCALLLGAKSATGVDIDALAVKTAVENGRENGFSAPRFTVLQGDLTEQVKGRFDIVVANIVADVIIRFCKDVRQFMKPGAFLSPPASSTPARRTFLLPSRNTALPFRSAMRMAVGSASFARHERTGGAGKSPPIFSSPLFSPCSCVNALNMIH